MPGHLAVSEIITFVERHGYALLFWWVLTEQSGIPVPSVPLLLAAGALLRTGGMHPVPAIGCCVAAALIADSVWFLLGRTRGRQVLRVLCRVSLEPDSCVRQTEDRFLKYGMKALLISKFVPGLNAVAAPLAGSAKSPYWRFLLYDGAGASIWCGAYLSAGYLFREQLEDIVGYASRMSGVLLLLIALFALWIARKFILRRRFIRKLAIARITPDELWKRMNAGDDLYIVDLRSRLSDDSVSIPGATRISPDELTARSHQIPRNQEIILYCS